jgi:hypothetical protein
VGADWFGHGARSFFCFVCVELTTQNVSLARATPAGFWRQLDAAPPQPRPQDEYRDRDTACTQTQYVNRYKKGPSIYIYIYIYDM